MIRDSKTYLKTVRLNLHCEWIVPAIVGSAENICMQGSRCHPKFHEAAEKAAKQFAKYEGAASPAVLMTEGSSTPEFEYIGLQGKTESPVVEVADYNADYQVRLFV